MIPHLEGTSRANAEAFETEFSKYIGSVGGVATDSCRSALVLALRTLGIERGDRIILPSYTCLSIANLLLQEGVTPSLVDCNYDVRRQDYNLDPQAVKEAIVGYSPPKAIVVQHMFGTAADVEKIIGFGFPVIEDITLSAGANIGDKNAGSFGDVAICSFHDSKMFPCGDGGMLLCNSERLLDKARWWNGWTSDTQHYQRFTPRYDFRMNEYAAWIGARGIEKHEYRIACRRQLAARYNEALKGLNCTLPDVASESVFHRYLIAVERGTVKAKQAAFRELGVSVGRGCYPAIHQYMGLSDEWFPNTACATQTLLSLPLYPSLSEADMETVINACKEVLR